MARPNAASDPLDPHSRKPGETPSLARSLGKVWRTLGARVDIARSYTGSGPGPRHRVRIAILTRTCPAPTHRSASPVSASGKHRSMTGVIAPRSTSPANSASPSASFFETNGTTRRPRVSGESITASRSRLAGARIVQPAANRHEDAVRFHDPPAAAEWPVPADVEDHVPAVTGVREVFGVVIDHFVGAYGPDDVNASGARRGGDVRAEPVRDLHGECPDDAAHGFPDWYVKRLGPSTTGLAPTRLTERRGSAPASPP